jgi:hypothetical protein
MRWRKLKGSEQWRAGYLYRHETSDRDHFRWLCIEAIGNRARWIAKPAYSRNTWNGPFGGDEHSRPSTRDGGWLERPLTKIETLLFVKTVMLGGVPDEV